MLRQVRGDELSAPQLYAVLALRSEVFVVEQRCQYLDPDGWDRDASTIHLWLEADDGEIASYLRVLTEPGGGRRIGRVVTPPHRRGHGLAADLLRVALADAPRPVVLNAQAHLVGMYERHGFVVDGDEFLDAGIPHRPMRLA